MKDSFTLPASLNDIVQGVFSPEKRLHGSIILEKINREVTTVSSTRFIVPIAVGIVQRYFLTYTQVAEIAAILVAESKYILRGIQVASDAEDPEAEMMASAMKSFVYRHSDFFGNNP